MAALIPLTSVDSPLIPIASLNPYAHVGNAWSLWTPAVDDRGSGLNLVSGIRKIASDIVSVFLIRKGEDPIHPDFGLAPDLFDSLSTYDAQYWVYHAQTEVQRWVSGISAVEVVVQPLPDVENRLSAIVAFTPSGGRDPNVLTFGWYEYMGAVWNREYTQFLDQIALNGDRFTGFSRS